MMTKNQQSKSPFASLPLLLLLFVVAGILGLLGLIYVPYFLFRPNLTPRQVECDNRGNCQIIKENMYLGDPQTFMAVVGQIKGDGLDHQRLLDTKSIAGRLNVIRLQDFIQNYDKDPQAMLDAMDKLIAQKEEKYKEDLKNAEPPIGYPDRYALDAFIGVRAWFAECVTGGENGQPLSTEQCLMHLGLSASETQEALKLRTTQIPLN